MTTKAKVTKRCGPQPLETETPAHDWTLEQLSVYAQRFNTLIADGERTLAPHYWHLGHALSIARTSFQHGQWQAYLASLSIDKTRSSKACAIYRAFSQPEALSGLSVEDAYGKRRAERPAASDADPEGAALKNFGSARLKIERAAERTFAIAPKLSPAEKRELIVELRSTMTNLATYVKRLEQELAESEERSPDSD